MASRLAEYLPDTVREHLPASFRPRMHLPSRSAAGWSIGGLIFAGLLVALGVWMYPEFKRYMQIRKM
jgi:hypothetical protein